MCRNILQFMTALPPDQNPSLRLDVIERRRLIEQRLSVFQQNHDFTYLIEKRWFTRWINFLIGIESTIVRNIRIAYIKFLGGR